MMAASYDMLPRGITHSQYRRPRSVYRATSLHTPRTTHSNPTRGSAVVQRSGHCTKKRSVRQPRHHSTSHSHRHCSAVGPTGPARQDTQRTPAEIPIIVLARKSHHSGPGPKLHQNITNLIPLRTAPASGGTPVLPQAQHIHLCGALTPAALHQSDALLLGKAPKILLGDVLWHAASGGYDVPN